MLQVRVPTAEEYAAFDGAHCHKLYRELGADWSCPCCHRTRYQCMRWTTLFPKKPHLRRQGWAVGLHRHHDHGTPPRFPVTPVCEQCNSADGFAKRHLGLPRDFSFSPEQIALFVTGVPHGKHLVNLTIASQVFNAYHSKPWPHR